MLKLLEYSALIMKKVAAIFSDAGVFDGAELQENVLTLLS